MPLEILIDKPETCFMGGAAFEETVHVVGSSYHAAKLLCNVRDSFILYSYKIRRI